MADTSGDGPRIARGKAARDPERGEEGRLEMELAKGERLKSLLLALAVFAFLVGSAVAVRFRGEGAAGKAGPLLLGAPASSWAYAFLVALLLGELLDAWNITRLSVAGALPPRLPRLLLALGEISLPAALVFFADSGGEASLRSPALLGYIVLYPLLVLRLEPGLCLAASVLACLELAFVGAAGGALRLGPEADYGPSWLAWLCLLVLLGGFAAAFAAGELRKRAVGAFEEARDRAFVLARFAPRDLLSLVSEEEGIDAGAARRLDAVILVAGIRSLRALADGMSAPELVGFLDEYLSRIASLLRARGGRVETRAGGEMLAFFDMERADGAIEAAVALVDEVERLNAVPGRPALSVGIGLHAGSIVLGTTGGPRAGRLVLVSDALDLASKLQAVSREGEARIVASREVLAVVKDKRRVRVRDLGLAELRPRQGRLALVEVTGLAEATKRR
jgi:class 3 adenylate cyclase